MEFSEFISEYMLRASPAEYPATHEQFIAAQTKTYPPAAFRTVPHPFSPQMGNTFLPASQPPSTSTSSPAPHDGQMGNTFLPASLHQRPSFPAPHDGHQTWDATKYRLDASAATDARRSAMLAEHKNDDTHRWELKDILGFCAESSGAQYDSHLVQQRMEVATVEERRNVCGGAKEGLGDLQPMEWLRIQSNHHPDDVQGPAPTMTSQDHYGR